MDYKEFKTLQEAQAVLTELDQKNGYPKLGCFTLTTARIEQIGSLYYLDTRVIDKSVNLNKSINVIIDKVLTGTTLERTKKGIVIKPI